MITCVDLKMGKLYIDVYCDACDKYHTVQLQHTHCIGLYLQKQIQTDILRAFHAGSNISLKLDSDLVGNSLATVLHVSGGVVLY